MAPPKSTYAVVRPRPYHGVSATRTAVSAWMFERSQSVPVRSAKKAMRARFSSANATAQARTASRTRRRPAPIRGVSQSHRTAQAKPAMEVREPVRTTHTAAATSRISFHRRVRTRASARTGMAA